MAKSSPVYICSECGQNSYKWIGKCPSCGQWNTFHEEKIMKISSTGKGNYIPRVATPVSEIQSKGAERIITDDAEINRVLGGGIVPGSLVLVSGEPGIGKSTLMLQTALSYKHGRVLYVTGEESETQIKLRADRLSANGSDCYISTEINIENIILQCNELKPELLVVDSIQTLKNSVLESAPGSITQIRECTAELMNYAKVKQMAVIIIGHITKDGTIAGPKILEHMVDTVLQFEGDRHHIYRILRTTKNRFGSTSELGIYEMQGTGLRQVSNPSEILISQRTEDVSGTAVSCAVEGMRPLLIEVQALVSTAVYGTPQRSTTGYDNRRLNMILAVLERKCGFKLGAQDVFVNIAGGLKVDDPGVDLAIAASILSSYHEIPLPSKTAFAGEIGLTGEIRSVIRMEQRISEAARLGFTEIFIPEAHSGVGDVGRLSIKLIPVNRLEQFYPVLMG